MKPIRLAWLTLLAVPILLTGCGVQGKWSLSQVDPTAARRDFPFEVITLQRDGTFYAEAKNPPGSVSGTYRYENNTLSLTEHDGTTYTFDATMLTANRLRLQEPWQDRELKAEFVRR